MLYRMKYLSLRRVANNNQKGGLLQANESWWLSKEVQKVSEEKRKHF